MIGAAGEGHPQHWQEKSLEVIESMEVVKFGELLNHRIVLKRSELDGR
jgi:hypothetical protein